MYLALSLISLSRHRSLEDLSITEFSLGGVRKLVGGDPGLIYYQPHPYDITLAPIGPSWTVLGTRGPW